MKKKSYDIDQNGHIGWKELDFRTATSAGKSSISETKLPTQWRSFLLQVVLLWLSCASS